MPAPLILGRTITSSFETTIPPWSDHLASLFFFFLKLFFEENHPVHYCYKVLYDYIILQIQEAPSYSEKEHRIFSQRNQIPITLTSSFTSVSASVLPYKLNINNSNYHEWLLSRLIYLMHIKYLTPCLVLSKCSINVSCYYYYNHHISFFSIIVYNIFYFSKWSK